MACAAALAAQAPADNDSFAKIRTEGLEHSQVDPVFRMLTVAIGPRLTASPAHKRAAEWMRGRLASYGWTTRGSSRGASAAAGLDAIHI